MTSQWKYAYQRKRTVDDVLRVGNQSVPTLVAGAVAGKIRQAGRATVRAIGPMAVNQAIKAITISQDYLDEDGIVIMFSTDFEDLDIDGLERTAINFHVVPVKNH